MRYQTVSVLVAGIPGLTVSVPYEKDEPIRLTLDRVTHKLGNTAFGDPHSFRSLYLDGIRIEDLTKSIRHYGLFGKTITYKASRNAQQTALPINFISEKQTAKLNLFSLGQRQKRSDQIEGKTGGGQLKVVTEEQKGVIIDIKEDETVVALKAKISKRVQGGLSAERQHLFFDGTRLEHSNTLAQYNIQSNDTIHLLAVKHLPVTRTAVFVKMLNGKTIVCRVAMTQTIEDLKRLIQLKENIPTTKQCLVYKRKYLLDDSERLESYGINNDDTLHLTIRLRGGSVATTLFADLSGKNGRIKKAWSSEAPLGRTACNGINVEVKCRCTKYQVISQQGFGLFELNETSTSCPNCNSLNVTPVTVGFSCCHYRIHGVKANGERCKSEWMAVQEDDEYQVYADAKQVAWRRLGIESRPLTDSTDDPCTICLEDIKNGMTLSCGHKFHKKCIAGWDMTCPNCRAARF